jgi:hypothetical protein
MSPSSGSKTLIRLKMPIYPTGYGLGRMRFGKWKHWIRRGF